MSSEAIGQEGFLGSRGHIFYKTKGVLLGRRRMGPRKPRTDSKRRIVSAGFILTKPINPIDACNHTIQSTHPLLSVKSVRPIRYFTPSMQTTNPVDPWGGCAPPHPPAFRGASPPGPPKSRSAPLAAAVGRFLATEPLVRGSFAAWDRFLSLKSDSFLNKPLVRGSFAAGGRTFLKQ